ncbi:MAG: prepilin-type N-terminal cleavage/methylation domain-containing protein [Candidatus Schmidhempelia sp.]|nr:prepilin-type N-terminal cleavage/methylation domain-containing protein [Candidatus Schmidhempelia sp.]
MINNLIVSSRHSQGFTLIELVVAMGVFAIISTTGITYWQNIKQRTELKTTTLLLSRFIYQIAAEANWQNKNMTVWLIKQELSWCIKATEDNFPPSDCDLASLSFRPMSSSVQATGLTEENPILFYGKRGMAQAGTIQLSNNQGITKIIVSWRGRIRYCSQNIFLMGIPQC